MAKRRHEPDTFEELESLGHRLAGWVQEHLAAVVAVVVGILAVAAAVGFSQSRRDTRADEASAAVAELRRDFVVAMGGAPADVEVPEPANPERAKAVREEFVARFSEAARQYSGTGASVFALFDAGSIYLKLGFPDQALELWEEGAQALSGDSPLRALLRSRSARLLEDGGRFREAAEAHEEAAAVPGYAMSSASLADAARCWMAAGDAAAALRVYDRLQTQDPEAVLPDYVEGRLEELRLRGDFGDAGENEGR